MTDAIHISDLDATEAEEVQGYAHDRLTLKDVAIVTAVSPAIGLGVALPIWAAFTLVTPDLSQPRSSGGGGGVRG